MKLSYNALYKALEKDLSKHIDVKSECPPEADHKTFACHALLKSLLAKCQDVTLPGADDAALEKFLSANNRCKDWKLEVKDLRDEYLVGTFREELDRFFYPSGKPILSDSYTIAHNGYTGPGASVGARGNDFYTKLFDSKLTCTSRSLYREYVNYISNDPRWADADFQRGLRHGFYSVVEGSRLTFVPKNETTSRVICTEPSLNMFFQLGVKNILEKRLKTFYGIDLSIQPDNNRELARLGSITGQFATIDLKSASDSIALSMIEEFLPNQAGWLRGFRSDRTLLPNGKWQELYMISSMGCGFTFPLETIIFSAVVSTCYHLANVRKLSNKHLGPANWACFGDDLIVDKRCYQLVVRLLDILGFQVNVDKTFSEGPFRESCGSDFHRGENVRSVFIKTLNSQESRWVAINRLNVWSSNHGVLLTNTIRVLLRGLRKLYVPMHEAEDAGLRIPFSLLSKRMDLDENKSVIYKRSISRARKLRFHESSITGPRGAKRRYYNHNGALLTFLHGDLRDMELNIRTGYSNQYTLTKGITPNWDYTGVTDFTSAGLARFENVITANLMG